MQGLEFIFQLLLLIMSVVVHEVSHGYMAYALGDTTAKHAGRLTLNPLKHLELFGSVLIPLFTYVAGGVIFGWAKPVPYNPYNLRNQRVSEALVAFAGPLSNIIIAVVFGLIIRFGGADLPAGFVQMSAILVFINLVLALINLIPIPPLDGSKLLFAVLPYRFIRWRQMFEGYFIFVALLAILLLSPVLTSIISYFFRLITGVSI